MKSLVPPRVSAKAGELRATAARLREFGVDDVATAIERTVTELLGSIVAAQDDELTVQEAADVSGYSISRIRAMLSAGALRNVGQPGRPRIRREDLPRKAATVDQPRRWRGPAPAHLAT